MWAGSRPAAVRAAFQDGKEPYPSALSTGCKAQGYGQVSLTGTAVAGQQDVLPPVDILTAGQLSDQGFIDRGLSGKVERVQGQTPHPRATDPPPRGIKFPIG